MSRLFGPMRQNGFVVSDIHRAIKHWVEVLGVGPFYFIDDQPLVDFQYLGQPSTPRFSVALAQSGGFQIELIQQHNNEPSAFRAFTDAGREGLQHVAFWTENFDDDLRDARERGLGILQSGRSGSGAPDERFVYFDSEDHQGTVIELSEISGRKGELFRRVAAAAESWDGTEPVRDMRELVTA